MAEALATMFRVNTEAWTEATYLRLPDRRALGLLRHVTGNGRVTNMFGRLQRWAYLDPQGQLAVLHSSDEEVTPLRLSSQEWRSMEEGKAIHRVMAQWMGELAQRTPSTPVRRATQELYALVKQAVENAKRAARRWPHRFSKPMDQTVWATLCLLHPDLMQSTAVAARMSQTGTPEDPPEPMRYLHHEIVALMPAEKNAALY